MAGGPTWLTKRDLPAHRDGYNYRRTRRQAGSPTTIGFLPPPESQPYKWQLQSQWQWRISFPSSPLLSAPLRSALLLSISLICHLSARIPSVSFESFLTYSSQFRGLSPEPPFQFDDLVPQISFPGSASTPPTPHQYAAFLPLSQPSHLGRSLGGSVCFQGRDFATEFSVFKRCPFPLFLV